jgi:hypothetical protein
MITLPPARWLAIALLGCSAATSGCQTPQSKYLATPLDMNGRPAAPEQQSSAIIVSGEEWEEMASPVLGAVEVTFENRSRRWVHVRTTSIRFGPEVVDNAVYTPMGEDLWAWQQATLRRNALRRANEQLALAMISGGGLMTSALAGRGSAVGAAGRLVALTSLGALLVNEASTSGALSRTTDVFPAGHLLGADISVPPGLFAKRWILFYTPEPKVTGCLRRMQLGYQLDDGQVHYVLLPFRDAQARSEWQSEVCPGAAQP